MKTVVTGSFTDEVDMREATLESGEPDACGADPDQQRLVVDRNVGFRPSAYPLIASS